MSRFIKHPFIFILALLIVGGAMYPAGMVIAKYIPPQNPEEIASVPIGDTVTSGTAVVDSNKIRKAPIIYHPEYLIEYAKKLQIWEIYSSLTSGAAPTPIKNITGKGISDQGIAAGIKGPGMVTAQEGKLIVTNPTFVWGYKVPHTLAVKTESGVDIKQENRTIRSVSESELNNQTINSSYISFEEFESWYNQAPEGNSTSLEYSLSNFNDGRNLIKADEIAKFFGEDVLKDMETHPRGQPIVVYDGSTIQEVVSETSTPMSYYSDLDNNARAHNANQFIEAWNNTVVPPHSGAHGSIDVYYYSVYDPDPKATVKWASHGVCPPGRALRDAAMGAGFPLPSGMTMDYTDSISNYADLVTGIVVENTGDYPVKIVLWSDGGPDGAGMSTIYGQIIELR